MFVLLRNHQILEQVETITLQKNNVRAHMVDFASTFRTTRNRWEKPCVSHVVKYTVRWESDGRKVPILWGKNGHQFPRLSQFDGFRSIFQCYGKLMGNPCISHIMNYIPQDVNLMRKKAPILWEKYEYQFPRFSTYDGFSRIFTGTNFPGFYHSMGFRAFSHAM